MRKIKNDVLDLYQVTAARRFICVTEPELAAWIERQKARKNFRMDLQVVLADLPASLRISLTAAQREASDEMR